MTTWNSNPYPPPDPNQGYYSQPGGYPPPGGYPQAGGYPPPGGYPQAGGYPQQPYPGAQGGYPNAPPPFYGAPPESANPYNQPQPPMGQYNQADMYGTNYPEDPEVKGFGFSDQSIRRGFIRKVYSILSFQLLVTCGFICIFVFHEPAKRYARENIWLMIVAFITLFVTMFALACCGEVRRKAPTNFILLGVFTLSESLVLGVISSFHKGETVLMAVGITAILCFGLTLFAFQTKFDFTVCGGFLFIAVLLLMVFGIIASIFASTGKGGQTVQLVYASIGALLFSVYLIYDTQLMMGGKHKYSISPEEYIFAALNLYLDIINIFLYILTILGASKD